MVNSGGRKCGCSLGYKVWLLSRVYSMVDSGVEGCCILLPEQEMCVQFGKKKIKVAHQFFFGFNKFWILVSM